MSASKGLLLQSLYATLARFTGVGLNFALQILIARLLSLGHYGDLRMLLTLVTGVALLSRIGVEQLLVKEVASIDTEQQAFGTLFLKRSYAIVFITSVLFILLWMLFSPVLKSTLFGEISLNNLMIASIGVLFFNIVTINSFYLKALRKPSASALVQNALPAVSFLLLIFIFWKDFPLNQQYINLYTASTIVAGLVSLLVIIPWVQRQTSPDITKQVPKLKTLVKSSLPLAPISLFSFLMLWSDTLMVGALLSNEEVGLYSTAASISFLSLFILGALDATIYPRLLSLCKNNPHQVKAFFWKATALVIVGLLLVTLVMALFAKPALSLFGPEFQQATTVLLILLAAQWLRATSLTFSFMFIIKERVRFLNITLVIALIINLVANYSLIHSHGMQGAAIATLIANGFLAGIVVLLFYRQKLLAGY
ncbi:MAG: oligosaccharide flippase family protein [Thiotrichaceae bacterium]